MAIKNWRKINKNKWVNKISGSIILIRFFAGFTNKNIGTIKDRYTIFSFPSSGRNGMVIGRDYTAKTQAVKFVNKYMRSH